MTENPSASDDIQKTDVLESYKSDADYLRMCANLGIIPSEEDYKHHLICQAFALKWEEENGCTVGSDILRYWDDLARYLKAREVNNAS